MKIGIAIYGILSADSDVTDDVSTRIFPNVAPPKTTFPFIVYDVTSDEPTDYKQGVSSLDTNSVMVSVYAETYTKAADVATNVRTALDRTSGTYSVVVVQSIKFDGYNDSFDEDSGGRGIYRKALDFNVRQVIT